MKKLERKIEITYSWWRSGGKNVNPNHVTTLEESAMARIKEMMEQGYESGELSDTVDIGHGETEYCGHWKVITTIPEK